MSLTTKILASAILMVLLLIGANIDPAVAPFAPEPPTRDRTSAGPANYSESRLRYDERKRRPIGPRGEDPQRRQKVQQKLARMPWFSTRLGTANRQQSKGKASAAQWEFLGPGNVGGRTRSLVIDPQQPEIMYAGSVTGGVWKTENAGASWSPTTDQLGNLNIAALVMDPTDSQTLYAGTGEIYLSTDRPYSQFSGNGILVTHDGAQSWQQLTATNTTDFQFVTDLLISPQDVKRLYAATSSGVWRSTDGGESWLQTLRPSDANGELLENGCNDLSFTAAGNNETVAAACGSRKRNSRYHVDDLFPFECPGDCSGRIYLNSEAANGDDWLATLTDPDMGRIQIATAASNPQIVYAVGASLVPGFDRDRDGQGDYESALHAVYRSEDGGLSWQARIRNSSANKNDSLLLSDSVNSNREECNFEGENSFRGQGWYDLVIAVDPTNEDSVWVGGIDLYRSDDGGLTWGQASYWWLDANSPNPDFPPRRVHADQHQLVFHPRFGGAGNNSQTLYALNDGGVYRTFNARQVTATGSLSPCEPTTSQIRWGSLANSYGVTQFYHGAVAPDGRSYIAGTQDNGTLQGTDVAGPNGWVEILGGDGAYTAINPDNPNVIYASSQGVSISKSFNGGQTFDDVSAAILDSGLFIMPYLMDPNDPETLFIAGTTLWRTTDGARSWQRASAPLGPQFEDTVSALALAPSNSMRLFIGNRKGIFRNDQARNSDAGSSFAMSTPRNGWVSSIAIEPGNSDVAYASYSTIGGSHLWRTTDAGATWQDIDGAGSGRLPDVPVHSITIDPVQTERLYLGTDVGVFVSTDAGYTWARESSGFAHVITEYLTAVEPPGAEPLLFAFTHGRGAWRVPLSTIEQAPAARTRDIDAATSGIWFNAQQTGHGFVIETISTPGGPLLLVYWFAYLDGQPVWIGGVGPLDRAIARIPMQITSGAGFPPEFSSTDVVFRDWGNLTITFSADDQAEVAWNSLLDEYGNNSLDLQRLTRVSDSPESCVSGAWFNPDEDGHGFLVELTQTNAIPSLVVYWFVYVNGQQTWLLGTAPFVDGKANLNMQLFSGADFPPLFDPDDLQSTDWGTLEFTQLDANSASVNWASSLPGFSSGNLDLIRLSTLAGHACSNAD